MAAGGTSGGGSEGIKAGRAYVEIGTKDAGLKAGLNAAKKAVLSLGKEFAEAGGVALGLGSALAGPVLGSLKEVTEHFAEIGRAAVRTGASTEAISDLGYAAKASGASLGDVEAGLRFLDRVLRQAEQGSDTAKEALAEFGATAEDFKGKDANERLMMVSKGLDRIEESARGPALRAIMGRGAPGALMPMLANSRELARLMEENGKLGGRVSKEDAENAELVEKAYTRTATAVKNAFYALGAAILPHADTISKFADALVDGVRGAKAFVDENRNLVIAVAAVGGGIAAAGAALVGIGGALAVAGVALTGIIAGSEAVATVVGGVISAGVVLLPVLLGIGVAVTAIAVGIAAFAELAPESFDAVVRAAGGMLSELSEGWDVLWGGITETFNRTWGGIKDAIRAEIGRAHV